MDLLRKCLENDEGSKNEIYPDTKGNLTAGKGHKLKVGDKILPEQSEAWFKEDVAEAIRCYRSGIPLQYRKKLNEARGRVIVCMIYQMGLKGVWNPEESGGFDSMWEAILDDTFSRAAYHMLSSKWHNKDSPKRAERLASIMETGEWPEKYGG